MSQIFDTRFSRGKSISAEERVRLGPAQLRLLELRTKLEAAGYPDETAATVSAEPASQDSDLQRALDEIALAQRRLQQIDSNLVGPGSAKAADVKLPSSRRLWVSIIAIWAVAVGILVLAVVEFVKR